MSVKDIGRDKVVRVGKDLIVSSHFACEEVPDRDTHSLRMSISDVILRRDSVRLALPCFNDTADQMVFQPRMTGLRRKTLLFSLTRSSIIVAIEFNRRSNHSRKHGLDSSLPRHIIHFVNQLIPPSPTPRSPIESHVLVHRRAITDIIMFLRVISYGTAGEHGDMAVMSLRVGRILVMTSVIENARFRAAVTVEPDSSLVVVAKPHSPSALTKMFEKLSGDGAYVSW